MLNKIYLIVLAVFVLAESVLTWYSCSWLASIDNPRTVVLNYEYYSYLSGTFLWISALILLVVANASFWKTRKSWAFWTTFLYFAVFVVLHTFWLDKSFVDYMVRIGLIESGLSAGAFFGSALCVAAAFIVFLNQFVAIKMRDKLFPPKPPVEAASDDAVDEKEDPE